MKAPLEITARHPYTLTAVATLQILHLLKDYDQDGIDALSTRLRIDGEQQDFEQNSTLVTLQEGVHLLTISPFDADLAAAGDRDHLNAMWQLFRTTDTEAPDNVVQYMAYATRQSQAVTNEFPGQYDRQARRATEEDLRVHLAHHRVVSLLEHQMVSPVIIWMNSVNSEECWTYWPLLGTSRSMDISRIWRMAIPALTAHDTHPIPKPEG